MQNFGRRATDYTVTVRRIGRFKYEATYHGRVQPRPVTVRALSTEGARLAGERYFTGRGLRSAHERRANYDANPTRTSIRTEL